jgi:hypothetical protein
MRFRPANISLINRRHYLPRLLLTLFSKGQMQKPHQRFEDVDRVTPYQVRVARHSGSMGSTVLTSIPSVVGRLSTSRETEATSFYPRCLFLHT